MVKHFYVWNVEQTTLDLSDGLTDEERDAIKEDMQQSWNDHETAEILLQSIPAKIKHRDGNEAFYSPVDDSITMPMREQFKGQRQYYGTMFHELIHWTGHRSRLDRLKLTTFGTDTYAAEELVAELGAAMICVDCRIDHERDEAHNMQHAAYLKSWDAHVERQAHHSFECSGKSSGSGKPPLPVDRRRRRARGCIMRPSIKQILNFAGDLIACLAYFLRSLWRYLLESNNEPATKPTRASQLRM